MNKKKVVTKAIAVMMTVGASTITLAGNVLWVDKKTGYDDTGRGTTEATAFRTIQAAVEAASSGDEIRVKPGVYDEGMANYNGWNNRVLISGKAVKIAATSSDKDATHITGSGSVRCICFHNATGSVVEGFTIRDGSAAGSGELNSSGGAAVSTTYAKASGCVVDCVVSNCVGVRGGAFRGVTAVRCWITENSASNSGGAGRKTDFVNCLITRNTGAHSCIYEDSKVVNCSVVDNGRNVDTATLYNSVILNNSDGSTGEKNVSGCSIDHCVTRTDADSTSPLEFSAPLYDDFRVLKGSDAETAGDASLIASASVSVPTGVNLYFDLHGNAIPASGSIAAGCIQTVVEPQGGAILFDSAQTVLTRGKAPYGKYMYAFAETWPTQFTAQAVNKGNPAIFCFVVNGNYVFPTMDDTIHIVPPAVAGVVYTNSVEAARATYYVDPENGSDSTSNGANAGTPYQSLQAAVTACGSSFGRVVRAAAGDYKTGGEEQGGLNNRVWFRGNGIRVIGAGADKSTIWGAPDPSTGGMGVGGTRCVYSVATRACIQGFTLRDGYANGSSSGDNGHQRGGGVYNTASAFSTTLHVTDCVITNCWAYRGGAGYSGAYERCHIVDCYGNAGVMRYGTLVSCVVDNIAASELSSSGNNNQFGLAYNTTFIGRNTDEYVVCRNAGTTFTNCIVMTTKELLTGTVAAGSLAWNVPTFTVSSGITLTDPKLVDVASGDYLPLNIISRRHLPPTVTVSPALGAGVWFDLPGFNVTDFNGAPLNLINGHPAAGAYQWPFVAKEVLGTIISIF